jgi:WD40 repeat protein
MSSLSSELDHYELGQSLLIHSGAVRSLAIHGNKLLSASFDKILVLSTLNAEGRYEETSKFSDSPSYLYSTCFNPEGTVAFAGTQDGRIIQWDFEGSRFYEGHNAVVCSMATFDHYLVSGSWD